MICAIDHVQLAMPADSEAAARAFYGDVLGLAEREKPEALKAKGGCWFERGGVRVHLGVDRDFRATRKAHPAFVVDDLAAISHRLGHAGIDFEAAEPVDGRARIFCADPFGNRIELMAESGL